MAVNLFNSRSGYSSRCKWYNAKYVNNNKLEKNAICEGVFYAKDKVAYAERSDNINGMARTTAKSLTIETNDYIGGLTINDYVDINGELWRVEAIPESDDYELAKPYSRRPRTTTTLELRR